jgi:nucleoid-associated protein YgaU
MARALLLGLLLATALSTGCINEEPARPPTPNPNPPTAARPSLAATTPVPSPSPSPSPSPLADGQAYTVASGDTLSSLAERFYGDATQWRLIFEANRDRMTSQDDLQVGMTLRIPTRRS